MKDETGRACSLHNREEQMHSVHMKKTLKETTWNT
jgi:hypothetical protein